MNALIRMVCFLPGFVLALNCLAGDPQTPEGANCANGTVGEGMVQQLPPVNGVVSALVAEWKPATPEDVCSFPYETDIGYDLGVALIDVEVDIALQRASHPNLNALQFESLIQSKIPSYGALLAKAHPLFKAPSQGEEFASCSTRSLINRALKSVRLGGATFATWRYEVNHIKEGGGACGLICRNLAQNKAERKALDRCKGDGAQDCKVVESMCEKVSNPFDSVRARCFARAEGVRSREPALVRRLSSDESKKENGSCIEVKEDVPARVVRKLPVRECLDMGIRYTSKSSIDGKCFEVRMGKKGDEDFDERPVECGFVFNPIPPSKEAHFAWAPRRYKQGVFDHCAEYTEDGLFVRYLESDTDRCGLSKTGTRFEWRCYRKGEPLQCVEVLKSNGRAIQLRTSGVCEKLTLAKPGC